MRTIYLAVVVPQMLYGVAAWYSPASGRTKYAKRQKTINEFEQIQTRAAVLISGAFRNTASAALGAELFLPPVRLHMQQMIEETAIRIQTGPVMSPMEALRWRKGGPLWTGGRSLATWESRKAHVLAPWELPLNCVIEGADSAVQEHDRICQENRRQIWYSDGSGFNGHIGGAIVSIRARKVRKKYLGATADSTYILRAIYERIRSLRGSGLQQGDIELRWIPAHIGIEGNERADETAKRAAIKGIELSSVRPRELAARPITRLAAAAKTDVRRRIQAQWAKWWERQQVGKPTKRLIPKPNKKMRTMRIGLRHFLFKIKQVDSDRCGCELGFQTPKYVLMECSLHLASRRIMMERLDSIEGLRERIQDYDAVMNYPQAIRYVADFMQRTGLLQQFRFATFNDKKDKEVPEPSTLLEGLDLNEEDDGYIEQ
ncbi:uncharacterized protein KD926_003389 [Aspergillus affinis]|uniref:uncharacterized protein n=1 Tax=Aspergillus affinis TaxID=1070780 RepID=UPI0022FE42F6|nr:uncharacterized protein KD926_003389 [Aspergillus affinis]KAI9043619.1 hypothetical protein KD926_003389 [Aspergillus affinis]